MESYSVLMSVYVKEKPEFLRESMESMFAQTFPTDDFVLVCDGPLTEELDAVIAEMQEKHPHVLHVIRLKENMGLGNALKEGIVYCKNELVARMDSDDISKPERCERQLQEFAADPQLDIVSGTIEEFVNSPDQIIGKRILPCTYAEICKFSRKRNPFNHPAVIFKKSSVINARNYSEEYHLFEDYALWVRMLKNGCFAINIPETLLYMRTSPSIYLRRGGKSYAKDMLRFHHWMRKIGWSTWIDYLTGAIPHAIICIIPNNLRKKIYLSIREKG